MKRWHALVWACVPILFLCSACDRTVSFANDTRQELRISGCFIDDALDIEPGERAGYDFADESSGCSVYVLGTSDYLGCVHMSPRKVLYRLTDDVDASTTQRGCEAL